MGAAGAGYIPAAPTAIHEKRQPAALLISDATRKSTPDRFTDTSRGTAAAPTQRAAHISTVQPGSNGAPSVEHGETV